MILHNYLGKWFAINNLKQIMGKLELEYDGSDEWWRRTEQSIQKWKEDYEKESLKWQQIERHEDIGFYRFSTEEVGYVIDTMYQLEISFSWGWRWDLGMVNFSTLHLTSQWAGTEVQEPFLFSKPYRLADNFFKNVEIDWASSADAISGICFIIANSMDSPTFTYWYRSIWLNGGNPDWDLRNFPRNELDANGYKH
jgi:hypothetical protein